ncbi:MAG: hypothetical protein K2L05_04010 [Muribaculaceae bacterium]|nr:hypothetical protein [Muribaculaceae bacterium]
MKQNQQFNIAGIPIQLLKRSPEKMTGLNLGEKLSFEFYDGIFKGMNMLFVKPKGKNPTPRKCEIVAGRLSQLFHVPVVFILLPGPTYERQRLVEKDIYFVMSDKYANLPMFVALERVTSRKMPDRLTPVAQYLLLYHLQIESIEGKSIRAIASMMPYSYESIAVGLTCMTDIGLCEKVNIDWRTKAFRFKSAGKQLWKDAEKFLINPVERRYFCDSIQSSQTFPICGINALAHYTMLNPDSEQWIMMSAKESRELINGGNIVNPNEFDGAVVIETWKYPVVSRLQSSPQWVDKLSLALSLRDDDDPRVEDELENMINSIQW